jgi:hypothetical protein
MGGATMLLLGGPAHGQEREINNGQTELVVMAPSPGNPLPTPWKYQVREIEAETRPGMTFRKAVLVEQGMPVEIATEALAQVLLAHFASELVRQFMEGGELVVKQRRIDDHSSEESGTGLFIAKR